MLLDSWTRFTTPASGVRLHSMGRKSMPCESSDCRVLCPTEYTEYACRALTDTGMCRLALSDEDKVVRDWFGAELQATGCEVSVDQMGNMDTKWEPHRSSDSSRFAPRHAAYGGTVRWDLGGHGCS
jgi:hypothetical protein